MKKKRKEVKILIINDDNKINISEEKKENLKGEKNGKEDEKNKKKI